MIRTQIYLPEQLHSTATRTSQVLGISLAEATRQGLELWITQQAPKQKTTQLERLERFIATTQSTPLPKPIEDVEHPISDSDRTIYGI